MSRSSSGGNNDIAILFELNSSDVSFGRDNVVHLTRSSRDEEAVGFDRVLAKCSTRCR